MGKAAIQPVPCHQYAIGMGLTIVDLRANQALH
jgi:hypothetical protein